MNLSASECLSACPPGGSLEADALWSATGCSLWPHRKGEPPEGQAPCTLILIPSAGGRCSAPPGRARTPNYMALGPQSQAPSPSTFKSAQGVKGWRQYTPSPCDSHLLVVERCLTLGPIKDHVEASVSVVCLPCGRRTEGQGAELGESQRIDTHVMPRVKMITTTVLDL